MIVDAVLVGGNELIQRFERLPATAAQALLAKVTALALRLENRVKTQKLDGQVLNRITGALSRSINNRVERIGNAITGYVFSSGDVKYARIHEYGGVIVPVKAQALRFMIGDQMIITQKVVMPERSYLRSSLTEMATTITTEMKEAVVKAVQDEVVHG